MDVDDSEIVDTSDVEEQQEILPGGLANKEVVRSPPRKRAKLFHRSSEMSDEEGSVDTVPSLLAYTTPSRTSPSSDSPSTPFGTSPDPLSERDDAFGPLFCNLPRTPLSARSVIISHLPQTHSPDPLLAPWSQKGSLDSQLPLSTEVQADREDVFLPLHYDSHTPIKTPNPARELLMTPSILLDPSAIEVDLATNNLNPPILENNIPSPSPISPFFMDVDLPQISRSPSPILVEESVMTESPAPSTPLRPTTDVVGGSPLSDFSHHAPSPVEPVPVQYPDTRSSPDNGKRYTLRRRGVAQIQPYTVDEKRYRRQVNGIRGAYVNMVRNKPVKDPTNRYENEDSQQDRYSDPYDDETDTEERRFERDQRREERKVQEAVARHFVDNLPEILRDDLSSDEDAETRRIRKEAKQISLAEEKRRRKLEKGKGREREGGDKTTTLSHKRLKRFPALSSPTRSLSRVAGPSNPRDVDHSHLHTDEMVQEYFVQHAYDAYTGYDDGPIEYEPSHSPRDVPADRQTSPVDNTSNSPQQDPDIRQVLPPKGYRCLTRMMPVSMARHQLAEVPDRKAKRRKPRPSSDAEDEEAGLLLPGQTRTRRIANPRDTKDIRGDSESEHESDKGSDGDSPLVQGRLDDYQEIYLPSTERRRRRSQSEGVYEVIEISSGDQSSSVDDDEEVQRDLHDNDEELVFLRHDKPLRRETLIDYMLAKNTNGRQRKRGYKASSRRRFDVVTSKARGIGRERQTYLSFDQHGSRTTGFRPKPPTASMGGISKGTQPGTSATRSGHTEIVTHKDGLSSRELSKKEQKKRRKERMARIGIHNFAYNDGSRIESGRNRETKYMTVVLEEEQFHAALAPPPKKRSVQRPVRIAPLLTNHPPSSNNHEHRGNNREAIQASMRPTKSRERQVFADLGLELLPSGRMFDVTTCIGRGLLQDMIQVISGVKDPEIPRPMVVNDFSLDPDWGQGAFLALLPRVCDALLDFVMDLPSIDVDEATQEKNWLTITHTVPQYLSWLLKSGNEHTISELKGASSAQISQLTARLKEQNPGHVANPLLISTWFCVEMHARLNPKSAELDPSPNLPAQLFDATSLLVQFLLRTGFSKLDAFLKNDHPSPLTYPTGLTIELWTSLIHLLGLYSMEGSHHLWNQLIESLENEFPELEGYKASEHTWRLIFSLCALSQFSVHGKTVEAPCLPACWDLVSIALKTVQLTADAKTDGDLSEQHLEIRDQYIRLIVTRCFHLRERWLWTMGGAWTVFSQLTEIFRTRRFAALSSESIQYPTFFLAKNWDSLFNYDAHDTAFVLFLKLIAQAAQEDKRNNPNGALSTKLKKLFFTLVPVSAVPLSHSLDMRREEISMFQNRLMSAAVVVYLDPTQCNHRIKQVRGYLNFSNPNFRARRRTISGMNIWAVLLVNKDMPLEGIADWVAEIAEVLAKELNEYPVDRRTTFLTDTTPEGKANQRVVSNVKALVRAVTAIVDAQRMKLQYPDPNLFHNLKSVLSTWVFSATDALRTSVGFLIDRFLKARAAALPRPERPALPAAVMEESQDYDNVGFDFDWDAVDLPEALAGKPNNPVAETDRDVKEELTAKIMQFCRSIISRYMTRFLKPPESNSEADIETHLTQCEMWLYCYINFLDIKEKKIVKDSDLWCLCLKRLQHSIKSGNRDEECWARRVEVTMMMNILKIEPMVYTSSKRKCFELLFLSLVSDRTAPERQYLSTVLSLGASHDPILEGADCLPARNQKSGDFELTDKELVDLRLSLLGSIFCKLDGILGLQGDVEVQSGDGLCENDYLSFCKTMFSAMRSTYWYLEGSKQTTRQAKYKAFCIEVWESLQQWPNLSKLDDWKFWNSWTQGLIDGGP